MTDMNESMFTALILFRMLVNSMQRFKQTDANRCILFNPLQDMFRLALVSQAFSPRPILSLLAQRRDADAALAALR